MSFFYDRLTTGFGPSIFYSMIMEIRIPVYLVTFVLLVLSGILPAGPSLAQRYENVYRPVYPDWYQLQTPGFRILFREGEEEAALRSAAILGNQYGHVQSLTGGSLSNMPVVLNSENDRSNGYVTTRHFRTEVEIPRIKGKTMNPSDGNWLNSVMPHELVHALHLNVIPFPGISSLVRPFSPDAARSLHFSAPTGMFEGIAVFHESHHHYGIGGRGNHPYFTNRFKASFDNGNRWSLGQMLMSPDRTYPFDRHYIGGHQFIHWLQYEYGMDITKSTIRFVSRWPILGYGAALWYHTGDRPSVLYRRFESEQEKVLENSTRENSNTVFERPPAINAMRSRRPFWITDETLLFYSVSYGKRPGFYSYNIQTEEVTRVLETRTVEDYVFSLHPDRDRFLYARYHRHPYFHNHYLMKVHEVFLEHDEEKARIHVDRLETGKADRIHAPAYEPSNRIWALQTHHENNVLVELTGSGSDTLLIPANGHLVQTGFHPGKTDSLFVLANREGMQALWLLERQQLPDFNERYPDIAFDNAAIYDPVWHPDGDRMLFTSDYRGTLNLYEFHLDDRSLYQLTDHRYGIMEGSYSPDGERLAAIQFHDNRYELVLLKYEDLDPVEVARRIWGNPPFSGPSPAEKTYTGSLPDNWSVSSYKPGLRRLWPRAFLPYMTNKSGDIGNQFGVTLSGGDLLRRNSYYADFSTSNNRFWYDLEYRFSGFYPGFRLKTFDRPVQTSLALNRQQGFGINVPITYRFEHDTRTSSLSVTPGMDLLRQQIITADGAGIGSAFNRLRGSLLVTYQHRLQQNIRDVQPNTGWVFFKETEWDFYTDMEGTGLRALRGGIYRYLSLYLPGNRSLRIGIEGMTQNSPYFDLSGFYSRGFDDNILADVNNAGRFNTRFTVPLWHIDQGWTLIPLFMDRLYAVFFTDTLVPLRGQESMDQLFHDSRTLYGVGLRIQMRIMNIPLELGIAAVYEPARERMAFFPGSF